MSGFLVRPEDVEDDLLILRGSEAHHLVRVRRHRPGERVEVIDGSGTFFEVSISSIEGDTVVCRILERREEKGESPVRLCLAPALVKGQRFDFVVEKGTEVGVDAFAPLVTVRGVARPGSENKIERWRRLAQAATKQCGRSRLPQIFSPAPLGEVIDRFILEQRLALMAIPHGNGRDLHALLSERRPPRVGLLIGPEGGFAPEEEEEARDAGVEFFSWGDRTLRADTASIVLAALVLHEAERAVTVPKGGCH